MKSIRCFVIMLCLVLLCTSHVCAVQVDRDTDNDYETDSLWEAIPPDAAKLMGDLKPTEEANIWSKTLDMLRNSADNLFGELLGAVHMVIRLFFTVMLCQLIDSVSGNDVRQLSLYAGSLALMAICLTEVRSMVDLGSRTMEQLVAFNLSLTPVMASVSAASGSMTGAGANCALAVFFFDILLVLGTKLIIPGIYCYLALGLTDVISGQERLKKLRELLGLAIELCLKALVYGFTGCLTLTGVLSAPADAAALKAAKSAISGMVPVVGGIISGAAEAVMAGAAVLKGTVGTFGLLAILAIFMLPFLNLFVRWSALKLSAAISGVILSPLTGLLDTVGKAMGYLLGMLGSSALICVLSCCCYFKAVIP